MRPPNRAAAVGDLAGVFACNDNGGRGLGAAGASVTSAGGGRRGGRGGGRWRGGGGSR